MSHMAYCWERLSSKARFIIFISVHRNVGLWTRSSGTQVLVSLHLSFLYTSAFPAMIWCVELGTWTNSSAGRLVSESRDRGSVTSLSSEFSLITEEAGGASSLNNDTVDLFSSQPQASSWSVSHAQTHKSLLLIYFKIFFNCMQGPQFTPAKSQILKYPNNKWCCI